MVLLAPCAIWSGAMPLVFYEYDGSTPAWIEWLSLSAGPLLAITGTLAWWSGHRFEARQWLFIPMGTALFTLIGVLSYQPSNYPRYFALSVYTLWGLTCGAILWQMARGGYLPFPGATRGPREG
jgi:hypothetical protein